MCQFYSRCTDAVSENLLTKTWTHHVHKGSEPPESNLVNHSLRVTVHQLTLCVNSSQYGRHRSCRATEASQLKGEGVC